MSAIRFDMLPDIDNAKVISVRVSGCGEDCRPIQQYTAVDTGLSQSF